MYIYIYGKELDNNDITKKFYLFISAEDRFNKCA